MKRIIVLLFVVLGGGALYYGAFSGSLAGVPDKVNAQSQPYQEALTTPRKTRIGQFSINKHHRFEIKALVLGAKHYKGDEESKISPVDLALGWGPMSSGAVVKQIRFSQSNRFYYYRYQMPPPIPKSNIIRNSANMHLIPSNPRVESLLKQAKTGDIVMLSGYLVDVFRDDGWRWRSSRTRSDSGKGACELIYVEDIKVTAPF